MNIYSGKIKNTELEGGGIIFESDSGEPFQIDFSSLPAIDLKGLAPGTSVTIQGELRTDVATLMMSGPLLHVWNWVQK